MITEIKDAPKWAEILDSVDHYDFYHTYDYHHISKSEGEEPLLLLYTKGQIQIAVPLLLREIADSDQYDATSVYGYSGPVSRNLTVGFDNKNFRNELREYLLSKKIVSVFSRLNPFVSKQLDILNDIGDINIAGQVAYIDMTKDAIGQRRDYNRRLKTQLNGIKRNTFVRKADAEEDFNDFVSIYRASMDRVGAAETYYFSQDYFDGLITSDSIDTTVLLTVCNETGRTMAGSLFMVCGGIAQYHLGGTRTAFMDRMPSKLLIDNMRERHENAGLRYFNLGGGLGCTNDKLFSFKQSFTKNVKLYSLWRYVVDPKAYNKLVEERKSSENKDIEYFPSYRSGTANLGIL